MQQVITAQRSQKTAFTNAIQHAAAPKTPLVPDLLFEELLITRENILLGKEKTHSREDVKADLQQQLSQ